MKKTLKKVWHGFLAGITSTEAVKAEKSIAALVIVRVIIAAGGSAALADLVARALGQ